MGSSGGFVGGGTPSGNNSCGGTYEFIIVMGDDIQLNEEILELVDVGEDVYINLIHDTIPKLEIRRMSDDIFIGYVPGSLSKLIYCIGSGWSYDGTIVQIQGSGIVPEITVRVEGIQ